MHNPPAEWKRIARLVTAAALSVAGAAHSAGDPFATCAADLAADSSHELARCIYDNARKSVTWEAAEGKLEELAAADPDDPWPRLYLGHVFFFNRNPQRARAPYDEALRLAQQQGLAPAEVAARVALTRLLSSEDRLDEAEEFLARAREVAEGHEDPQLLATVLAREALQMFYKGQQLDAAYNLLLAVKPDLFPDGPADARKDWLVAMGNVADSLGRYDDVLSAAEAALDLAQKIGDRPLFAWARYLIAGVYVTVELPTAETRERALFLYQEALTAARAAGHPVEGLIRFELGRLLAGDEGRLHLQACLEIARRRDDAELTSRCEGALAAKALPSSPEEALRRIEEVLTSAAASTDDPWWMVNGWEERLTVYWQTLAPEEALRRSLDVVDRLETLRESQVSGVARAGLVAGQAGIYYWLSGRLLADADRSEDRQRDLERAFHVIERMRARVLLETLAAARAARPPDPTEASDPELARTLDELAKTQKRKVGIQRRLLDPRLPTRTRTETVAELSNVEREEAGLRHRLAELSPLYAELRPEDFATLGTLQQRLDDDEALLSFQLAYDEDFYGLFGGGSWLLVVTRAGTRYYRLPGRAELRLDQRLDVLVGLDDPGDADAALALLYDDLLGKALEELPETVERLVIVPDEELHRLPVALLRPAEDGAPLIADYQLSIVPSASLWLRWRDAGSPAPADAPRAARSLAANTAPVLAFADPVLDLEPPPTAAAAGTRGGTWEERLDLGPLDYARKEGQAIVRILGGDSLLLTGDEASEDRLKTAALGDFDILHFAAHTVINVEVPGRSAVFLAPGSAGEDGWLQPAEIAELDLDGRLIVLASCDTATGQVLRGEGVMSIARAFFHAGAPAVVASLWPLPDEQSAELFKYFYRRLARGASVGAALADAQRVMIRQGVSGRAWAGVMILGNAEAVPFPGGLEAPAPRWIVPAAVLILLLFFVMRYRHRARSS